MHNLKIKEKIDVPIILLFILIVYIISLSTPYFFIFSKDMKLLHFINNDAFDFVQVVENMFNEPYYNALNHHAGFPYGYPLFSLAFIITWIFRLFGNIDVKIIIITFRCIMLVFSILTCIVAYNFYLILFKGSSKYAALLFSFLTVGNLGSHIYNIHPDCISFFFGILTFYYVYKYKEKCFQIKNFIKIPISITICILSKTYFIFLLIPLLIILTRYYYIYSKERWSFFNFEYYYYYNLAFIINIFFTIILFAPYLFSSIQKYVSHMNWEMNEHSPINRNYIQTAIKLFSMPNVSIILFLSIFLLTVFLLYKIQKDNRNIQYMISKYYNHMLYIVFCIIYVLFMAYTLKSRDSIAFHYLDPAIIILNAIFCDIIIKGLTYIKKYIYRFIAYSRITKFIFLIFFKGIITFLLLIYMFFIIPWHQYLYRKQTYFFANTILTQDALNKKILSSYNIYIPEKYTLAQNDLKTSIEDYSPEYILSDQVIENKNDYQIIRQIDPDMNTDIHYIVQKKIMLYNVIFNNNTFGRTIYLYKKL